MELLDRYLQQVRFWLPKAGRQDIIAELSEDLRSEIEQQEAERGRPLVEAEVETILERWGHPIRVAGQYMPQRQLIGPSAFPLYVFVLKMALWYLVPWMLVWIGLVLFGPGYRAAHPGLTLVDTLRPWWLISVHWFAFVTLGFAYLERTGALSRSLEHWSPRKLPAVRDPDHIPRGASAGGFSWYVFLTLWWLGIVRLPTLNASPADPVHLALAPIWGELYWPVLAFWLGEVAIAVVNLWRPRWTGRRAACRLALDVVGLVLAVLLLQAGTWFELTIPSQPAAEVAKLAQVINLSVAITLVIIAVTYVVAIVRDVRRLFRRRDGSAASRGQAAGSLGDRTADPTGSLDR